MRVDWRPGHQFAVRASLLRRDEEVAGLLLLEVEGTGGQGEPDDGEPEP